MYNDDITSDSEISGKYATILQVIPALGNSGGVERGTVEIADAIVKHGGRAIVASSGGPKEHDLHRIGATHITLPLKTKNPISIYKNIDRLLTVINREKVDLVHTRSRAPAWSALYAARRANVPLISTFHGTYSHENLLKRYYNSVMTRGEQVIAISGFIAAHVRQHYGVPSERIHTIHRGVDLSIFNTNNVSAERVISLANK